MEKTMEQRLKEIQNQFYPNTITDEKEFDRRKINILKEIDIFIKQVDDFYAEHTLIQDKENALNVINSLHIGELPKIKNEEVSMLLRSLLLTVHALKEQYKESLNEIV